MGTAQYTINGQSFRIEIFSLNEYCMPRGKDILKLYFVLVHQNSKPKLLCLVWVFIAQGHHHTVPEALIVLNSFEELPLNSKQSYTFLLNTSCLQYSIFLAYIILNLTFIQRISSSVHQTKKKIKAK